MTSTSCCGMRRALYPGDAPRTEAPVTEPWRGRAKSGWLRRRLHRAAHRIHGDDPAQHSLAVHGHDRAEAGEALLRQQGLERLLEPDAQAARAVVAGHHRSDGAHVALVGRHALDRLA